MRKETAHHNARGNSAGAERAEPILHQRTRKIQPFGRIAKLSIALDEKSCVASIELLILADSMTLRDLYKKYHRQAAGKTFYPLHLLFDEHFNEQLELVDAIAERIQLLGGVTIAMAADVAETTMIPRPPRGREEVRVQLCRLLEAHELIAGVVRFRASGRCASGAR